MSDLDVFTQQGHASQCEWRRPEFRGDSEGDAGDNPPMTNEKYLLGIFQENTEPSSPPHTGKKEAEGRPNVEICSKLGDLDASNPNAEDETVPAIQIYKTFSLANFETANEQTPSDNSAALSTSGGAGQQDSYMITDLDYTTESEAQKREKSDQDISFCGDTRAPDDYFSGQEHLDGSTISCPVTAQYDMDEEPVGCHVINLEGFKDCTTESPLKANTQTSRSFSGSKVETPRSDRDAQVSENNNSFLLTPDYGYFAEDISSVKHAYEDSLLSVKAEETANRSTSRDTESHYRTYERATLSVSSDENLRSQHGEETHKREQVLETTCANTSNMVVDLEESMALDHDVFDFPLTTKHLKASAGSRPWASTASFPMVYTSTPYIKSQPGERFAAVEAAGGDCRHGQYKLGNTAQYNIQQQYLKESFYPGDVHILKTHYDPYITDKYGYQYKTPFYHGYPEHVSANHYGAPGMSWDNLSYMNQPTCVPIETGSHSTWFSENTPGGFFDTYNYETYDTSGIAQCSQPSNIEDGEETDDAEETKEMGEMAETPYYHGLWRDRVGVSTNVKAANSPAHSSHSSSVSASMTPPPSASSTPMSQMSCYESGAGQAMDDMHFFNSWLSHGSASSSAPMDTSSPIISGYHKPTLAPYTIPLGIKPPYPSMADGKRSADRPYLPPARKQSNCRSWDENGEIGKRRVGKHLKHQIQSDAISTSSTASGGRGGRLKMEKSSPTQMRHGAAAAPTGVDQSFSLSPLGAARPGVRYPRHNEPLDPSAVEVMARWYNANIDNPYPTKAQKLAMAQEGRISENQVKSWFANKRNRTHNTKPKVQKRAMEEKLKQLFQNLKRSPPASQQDNSQIIQQLSGIIQTCHMKFELNEHTG